MPWPSQVPTYVHMSEKLTPLVAFNDDHEQLIPSGSDLPSDED
jgi:hypothetical protein